MKADFFGFCNRSLLWVQCRSMHGDPHVLVRSYTCADQPVCQKLFLDGLIGGRIADGDIGADVNAVEQTYLSRPESHFWVAELDEPIGQRQVVGMVGVQHHGEGTAEVRRLRVDGRFRRRGVGSALLEQALHFCREQNYLRVILDTYMERDPAIKLFEKFSFRHGRTRRRGEKDLLYFYLDLYGAQKERGVG